MINKIDKGFTALLYTLTTIVLGSLTLFVLYTVVLRFVFHKGFPAGEELCRYLFVWSSALGIVLGVNAGTHMKLDILEEKLPVLRIPLKLFYYLCSYLLFGIIAIYGTYFASQASTAKSTLLPITMDWIYGAIPLCGYMCLFIITLQLVKDIASKKLKRGEEGNI